LKDVTLISDKSDKKIGKEIEIISK
jgi:hypothetical protein